MRVVFLGSPAPCIPVLNQLAKSKQVQLVGVVTQPAKPAGRGKKLEEPPIALRAMELGIPLLQPASAKDPGFLDALRAWEPDVALTAAYGQILSENFLGIPKRATINIHPSLLPRYRGATPVQSAILEGAKESGVSVLFTVKALDAGNIISQRVFPIAPDESAEAYMTRMFGEGAKLLEEDVWEKLTQANYTGISQDPAKVSHCRKIAKTDGEILWAHSGEEIYNRFRAFSPWPGVYTFCEGRRVLLSSIRGVHGNSENGSPGKLRWDASSLSIAVASARGEVLVDQLKWEGKSVLDARAFWNGLKSKECTFGSK